MNDMIFPAAGWVCPECAAQLQPVDTMSVHGSPVVPAGFQNRHFLFRRSFRLEKNEKPVILRITADDYYKLQINGKSVGQGPAQGYHFCYYWNQYDDIGEFLQNGENELVIEVYYHGAVCRAYNSGDNRCGLIAELIRDGQTLLGTDESWEYAEHTGYGSSQVTGADVYFPEHFDSREKLVWRPCVVKRTDHIFSPAPVTPVSRRRERPVREERLADGSVFYDFGREITAMLEIETVGESGTEIRILSGEEASGTAVRFHLRCNCEYDESFTLADGYNHREQFDYKGFRYVRLIPDRPVSSLSLTAIVRHYPFDENHCVLESEDMRLLRVFQLCKDSVKYGAQETFIDCPTREKGQYAGDLLITGNAHMILTGDGTLFKKALDNLSQSSEYSETLLAVAPGSFRQEIADYSLLFPLLALKYYEYFGDKAYLAENFEICKRLIDGFRNYERKDGLLCGVRDKWNLVDWPANLRDGYDFRLEPPDTQPHNVLNAFYIGCVCLTEQIAKILHIPYVKCSGSLIDSFEKEFYDPGNKLYTDCKNSSHTALHSNVLPVFFGFARQEAHAAVLDMVMEKGLSCGVYFSYFVLKALCRMGRYEQALALILSDGEHSWRQMLSEGATTCFEAWGKEQKHNTSLCHPWASAPVILLAEDILPHLPSVGKIRYKEAVE